MPLTHGWHEPLPSQTPPLHAVPAGALPLAVHTGAPLSHASVPVVHGLPVVHDTPLMHGLQTPWPSQTPPGHVAPAAVFPLGMHVAVPALQFVTPVVHGLPVWHGALASHAGPMSTGSGPVSSALHASVPMSGAGGAASLPPSRWLFASGRPSPDPELALEQPETLPSATTKTKDETHPPGPPMSCFISLR